MSAILAMPETEYHADPAPEPSLSSSIAAILCQQSPRHAFMAHPRLNPAAVHEDAEHFDIGTVAHAMLLEGRRNLVIVDANDWRTNAAKDQRDAARAEGKVPILLHKLSAVEAMVSAAREQLDAHEEASDMFTRGTAEGVLLWQEANGIYCRARLDWLHEGSLRIDDYKTTSASANPEVISRTLFANGWDIQAAFYLRGLNVITDEQATFRFCVQETYPPYALSVIALGPDAMTLGTKKVLYAIDTWGECWRTAKWPAYPTRICHAELPTWEESKWLTRETQESL